jgi:hypothetical protein
MSGEDLKIHFVNGPEHGLGSVMLSFGLHREFYSVRTILQSPMIEPGALETVYQLDRMCPPVPVYVPNWQI